MTCIPPTDPEVPTAAADLAACHWVVRLPDGGLRCAVHDVSTAPWNPARGCALPVAGLCQVCAREAVPIDHRFSWSFVCPRCGGIDRAIGRQFGAVSATPIRGQRISVIDTLFGRLHPDRAPAIEVIEAEARYRATREVPPPLSPYAELSARFTNEVGRLAGAIGDVAAPPTCADPSVSLVRWQAARPPSVAASAEAYRRLVVGRHPWLVLLEPRVTDRAWLESLIADA
ncbi:hypothetical protein Q6346_13130 [Isoptericola sp. b490]|uniref:hypothetical protein n=1 Tax=Actinotalea lenta TaxID=3064654 RepID=UPI002714181F|nr:hypothetical protein [Isoptericola sp. b490]MDO8122254.1 hypothetical protein [Isoptericola sp. b490]